MENELFDLVIHDGQIVTAQQTLQADLAIRQGKVAAIGPGLKGAHTIDAHGLLVLPGGVDPHVHLETPVGVTNSSDDWFTGTRAAAYGGTTTVIDFVEPGPGETLDHALNARRRLAERKAVIDFGLHMTLTQADEATLVQIPAIVAQGCPSFKTYTTYEGFKLTDTELLRIFEEVTSAGGISLVHAEQDAILAYLRDRLRRQGKTAPLFHTISRPAVAEAAAMTACLALAEVSAAQIYFVHVSTSRGLAAIRAARKQGVRVLAETCPQYLLLTDRELERPGFGGACFVCSPPLRVDGDCAGLWDGLGAGDLDTVATDHCPFFYEGQKDLGKDTYEQIPAGLPGIELRLALLYTFGVLTGKISLNRWVELCCSAPAQIFGLYPRKGTLEAGCDADLVLFDPLREVTLTRAGLHEQVDYTPYEGFRLRGYPILTILRGKILVENGHFMGTPGDGNFLARQPAMVKKVRL